MELSEYLKVDPNYIRSLQRDKETGGYSINTRGAPGLLHVSAQEITEHSLTWYSYELTAREPTK